VPLHQLAHPRVELGPRAGQGRLVGSSRRLHPFILGSNVHGTKIPEPRRLKL
jgi:hypothetical protein